MPYPKVPRLASNFSLAIVPLLVRGRGFVSPWQQCPLFVDRLWEIGRVPLVLEVLEGMYLSAHFSSAEPERKTRPNGHDGPG